MNSNPQFSIIIPVYNTIKELPRCVESIVGQTLDDYEIILVDDGSTDGSSQFCDELASKNSRIKCIHQKNAGAANARNIGISAAIGEFLMFVDSDDMWSDKQALNDIRNLIVDNSQVDLICFGVEIIKEDGTVVKLRKPELPTGISNTKEAILTHLVYTNQYFSASYVKVIRREFFIENNLFFKNYLVSGEDIDWSARAMVKCQSMVVYSSTFYKRIMRDSGSITSNIKVKNINDVLFAIDNGVKYAEAHCENKEMLDLYYEYWTYQYAMLFSLMGKIKQSSEYKDILSKLKEKKWLLKYDHVKKVKMIKLLCAVFGVKTAVSIVGLLYR